MKKHILAALMTLVITSALLTGCGGRDTTPASPPVEPGESQIKGHGVYGAIHSKGRKYTVYKRIGFQVGKIQGAYPPPRQRP